VRAVLLAVQGQRAAQVALAYACIQFSEHQHALAQNQVGVQGAQRLQARGVEVRRLQCNAYIGIHGAQGRQVEGAPGQDLAAPGRRCRLGAQGWELGATVSFTIRGVAVVSESSLEKSAIQISPAS